MRVASRFVDRPQMPSVEDSPPDMKCYLTVLVPLFAALALSCGAPKQFDEPRVSDNSTPPVPTSTSVVAPLPTPTQATPLAPRPRGVSVRLAEGRNAPVVRVVPRDLISAVFDPVHISAADVGEQVGQATPVIGVSIGGESVAYPVAYLSSREVVNDTVGGKPIVVTW